MIILLVSREPHLPKTHHEGLGIFDSQISSKSMGINTSINLGNLKIIRIRGKNCIGKIEDKIRYSKKRKINKYWIKDLGFEFKFDTEFLLFNSFIHSMDFAQTNSRMFSQILSTFVEFTFPWKKM